MSIDETILESEAPETPLADAPPLSRDREVALIRELTELSAARAAAETGVRDGLANGLIAADAEFEEGKQALEQRVAKERQTLANEYNTTQQAILDRYETDHGQTQQEFSAAMAAITTEHETRRVQGEKNRDDADWEAKTLFDAKKEAPGKQFRELLDQIDATVKELNNKHDEVRKRLKKWGQTKALEYVAQQDTPGYEQYDQRATLQQCADQAEKLRTELLALRSPGMVKGIKGIWVFLLVGAIAAGAVILFMNEPKGYAIAAGSTLLLSTMIVFFISSSGKAAVNELYPPYCQAIRDATAAHGRCVKWAEMMSERERKELEVKLDARTKATEKAHREWMAQIDRRRDSDSKKADATYPPKLAEITKRRDRQLKELEAKRTARAAEIEQNYQRDAQALQQRHRNRRTQLQQEQEDRTRKMFSDWQGGIERITADVADIQRRSTELFPEWSRLTDKSWKPATTIPPAMRVGQFDVRLEQIPHGISQESKLAALAPAGYTFPALTPFPAGCSLVLKTKASGRAAAITAMQTYMLRLLTSIPPSKCRFTIVDPVGLGESFSAFMHLADHQESLVTNRIWTDPRHIEQRLADIAEHMENVIQKYLRNEFATIEEYNVDAGEIAEPFRFLVVADFPHNFSEAACKRLFSIAASGARCGVFTIISVDTNEDLPDGFDLKELERQGTTIFWKKDRAVLKDRALVEFPLTLDSPPAPEDFTAILHTAGRLAKAASKVEVPFSFIAPRPEDVWTSDSRKIIDVPLGRAGATRLQHMQLGLGTSQHSLVAGKTGSGKSTMLHALITNAALRYSPDELELYLIDFKKGVEFKTYATHELPHARVIAVESDREFGLSVLERLDAELKRRGDDYRIAGAQDVASYRANTGLSLPRVMLIIDEFQEFFIEDDKVAQDTTLLLDRLVRQGRAFGVHVMLGSQTLGGAYALPRSTLGQMAVRIALQCSEADAHLILNEDNTAARLLSRPGDAIYNDSNGMVEGNHPFQVVWLSDEVREGHLKMMQERARREGKNNRPRIVFEGNVPAELPANALLDRLLREGVRPGSAEEQYAWLGDSVAIKDPTAAVFRPQSGSNLLIVGQNDEATLGIFAAGILGLYGQRPEKATADEDLPTPTSDDSPAPAAAALGLDEDFMKPSFGSAASSPAASDASGGPSSNPAAPPAASARSALSSGGAKFFVFDGAAAGSPQSARLAEMPSLVPTGARLVTVRNLPQTITEVSAEVARRMQPGERRGPPIYLYVYGLQRLRDLRKEEDDFSFSRDDKPPSPGKQFVGLLRDGPPVDVHVIVWVDSLTNLQRCFDRPTLREFEMRILYQMSANDSSTLIDGPAASKLGTNRALFNSEEQNRMEKFRPYGDPPAEWLSWAQERLRAMSDL